MMLDLWKPRNANGSALLPSLEEEFGQLFSQFDQPLAFDEIIHLAPAADISEDEDELRITLDLPGHDPKQMKIQVEGDTLTVHSERKVERDYKTRQIHRMERSQGVFTRSFTLPNTVDASKAQANFEHGTLTLTLPKREESKPRAIEVKVT